MVILWGFNVIFGIKDLIPGKDDAYEDLINKKYLLKTVIKMAVLITLISPNGLQNVDNSLSLSGNFALIDELLAFFDDITVMSKIMSFFFDISDHFLIGMVISVILLLLIVYYVVTIAFSAIPFVNILLQLAILLPLAPFFLLLWLFKSTENYFTEWMHKIVALCLELVAFFTAFYFYTSIINNYIKNLLNFKVCFVGSGDAFDIGWEWLRNILNNFVVVQYVDMREDFFMYYIINILIVFCLIYLFKSMTTTIMQIIASVISVDGVKPSTNTMKMDDTKDTFGNKATEFFNESGLSTLQKESDSLKWTRNVLDLSSEQKTRDGRTSKGNFFTTNMKTTLSKTGKAFAGLGKVASNFIYNPDKEEGETTLALFWNAENL